MTTRPAKNVPPSAKMSRPMPPLAGWHGQGLHTAHGGCASPPLWTLPCAVPP
jgi:hypothetical protein